jgi:AraC family transcriptional regulator
MEPKIVHREAFRVMGVVGHFSSAADDFGPLWNEAMAFHERIEPLGAGEGHYGVYLGADHSQPIGYLAGVPVQDAAALPEGMTESLIVHELLAATYAVFECRFTDIGSTYGFIWSEWLKTSAYEQDKTKLGFDYYPPATISGESLMQIWFPVKEKDPAA